MAKCNYNRATRCDTHTARLNLNPRPKRSGEDASVGAKHNGVLPILDATDNADEPSRRASGRPSPDRRSKFR